MGLPADSSSVTRPCNSIAVRPAVYGEARDVTVKVKVCGGQHPTKMLAHLRFIVCKGSAQHAIARFFVLLCAGFPQFFTVRSADHLNYAGIVRRLSVLVPTQADREIHEKRLMHIPGAHGES